ncbi:methyltransferase domain-containing protein [Allobaculum sp. JKK-2023]|uniref:methyltransferase domain-containing protein n=1 Tax=Allobaculum sp. JKK-2023 TaxID=3108943 RepID=UPI002B056011|nr:methyltransferase domain-containing protein [Allobaculum sp. JKK-2023]
MNCPICHEPLIHEGRTFKCKNSHNFDQARQGYVNLSRKQKASGDNALMVKARTAFLEAGPYDFLRQAILETLRKLHPDTYLDLGCGQGYYTHVFSQAAKEAYGIDLSVPAIAHAAGQDKKTQYVVGSIYDLPFADKSIDAATSIFTPIPAQEAARVLKDNGYLITVTPGTMHHYELKEQLYAQVRFNPPLEPIQGFELVDHQEISQVVHVDDVMTLLEMTPYFYKTPKAGIEKIQSLKNGLDVTFDFVLSLWRKIDES